MNFRFLLTLTIFACLLCTSKTYAEEQWSSEVVGEVVLEDMTPQQAEVECLIRAKARAVRQVAGTKITSETVVKDSMMFSDFVNAQCNAWVKKTRDEKWEHDVVKGNDGEPPKIKYRVRLKALVDVGDKDAGFDLKVELDRVTYQSGDEMHITVQPGQDAHITVFNILEEDIVTVLLPNRFLMDRFVKNGEKVHFPDPKRMEDAKLKLFKDPKSKSTKEAILVIATLDNIDLVGNDFSEAVFAQYPRHTGLFRDILQKLKKIPSERRAMAVQYYEIKDKKQ